MRSPLKAIFLILLSNRRFYSYLAAETDEDLKQVIFQDLKQVIFPNLKVVSKTSIRNRQNMSVNRDLHSREVPPESYFSNSAFKSAI